jgi:hypothetical protein
MWQIFCFEICQYFTSGLQAFSFQSCQICFHQVTQKTDPNLTLTIVWTRNKKMKPTTTKRSAETKRKLPWKKLKWISRFDSIEDPTNVWLLIRKRWQVKWWKQCFSGHVSNLAHMLQHTFQSGQKWKKKKEPTNLCGGGGLCKLGKGDRRSHVRLAVSQAGAILTDKSYEKGGDSAAGWLQESPWWQMVDLEFGIPFPLVLQCQCLLLLLSFSRLAKSGYLPPPSSSPRNNKESWITFSLIWNKTATAASSSSWVILYAAHLFTLWL